MDPEAASFSELLRRHRVAAGLTQAALAERTGLSVTGVQKLERAPGRPYRDTVERLVAALDLQADARAELRAAARRASDQPSTRTAGRGAGMPSLPEPLTSFVGREREIDQFSEQLGSVRLLTLTGVGGCGKTRLAVEVARAVAHGYADGVRVAELASLDHPTLVAQTVASVFGVREAPAQPLVARLVSALKTRQLLLLLDNCEHLIEASAQLVDVLLRACPGLRILATSREALGIDGEVSRRVLSLSLPPLDPLPPVGQLNGFSAVRLFVERANAVQPEFILTERNAAAVARICHRLDGIPLALELAAARTRALGINQILERLDNSVLLLVGGSRTGPTRQQTLRATLDWSYALLNEPERAVFRRVAVFADSCTLEAAETVCADVEVPNSGVLDVLARLVDKSLVVVDQSDGNTRYRLLEPVRQYAEEQLVARTERDATRQRHALFYLAFAEPRAQNTNTGGPQRLPATRELAREYPNLRAALAWSIEAGETQLGLRLAGSLLFFWQIYGSLNEGRGWVEKMLAMRGADEPTLARGWVVLAGAWLAHMYGDTAAGRDLVQQGLELAELFPEPLLQWSALQFAAVVETGAGDLPRAELYAMNAAKYARTVRAATCEASSLARLALIACEREDFDIAVAAAEQAARIAHGDAWTHGRALAVLGRASLGQGALDQARLSLEAALAVVSPEGDLPLLMPSIMMQLGELETAACRLDEAADWLSRSLEIQQRGGERTLLPGTFERVGALAAKGGRPELSIRLAGAAQSAYDQMSTSRTPAEERKRESWLSIARQCLGESIAERAWAEGIALSLEEAIALARDSARVHCQHLYDQAYRASASPAGGVLTAREQEVVVLLGRGLSNRQIGDELVISARTVQRHVENILAKLGFNNRAQIAAWAAAERLASAGSGTT
jgi:non-specific serine/threonine protein kinase